MKEFAAQHTYMLPTLQSVVGRSADYIFELYMFHVITQADGKNRQTE